MLVAMTLTINWVYPKPGEFTSDMMFTPAKEAEKLFGVLAVSSLSQKDTT